ncbi:MAG TPA: methylenetetrahydrofolate reductase [Candidatus Omnitrophota bacterium]|nr:methylenetetrahydrofolate reductase [Candidatus Omnitrophota bacterium]HRZ14961.1 methylenetetrahydrofolate reductase [Candidatus Omnitrophota bacterium]
MTFREKLTSGRFLVTTEIGPPKGIDIQHVLDAAESTRGRVDALNVTDLQSSIMRLGSLVVSGILQARGFEPICQVTCRDRNRLALQSDILSVAALGIENLLILTGDYPTIGDHPEAKPVFDLDAVQLLEVVGRLQRGEDMNGNKLIGPAPRYFAGAVVNPGADPLEPELIKMEKKVRAGAQFFQTQAVFDVEAFERFMHKVRYLNVPVLAGIILLKSEKMARYLNQHVPGICVPQELIQKLSAAGDKAAVSCEIAAALIRRIKPLCRGVHIIPIGWDKQVPLVLDAAGINP